MAVVDGILLASKFRGCMLGALLGDCLGSPFEGEEEVSKGVLQKYFDKLEGPYFKAPYKAYTDDTAMSKCVAESLIEKKGFDATDMAKRFVAKYFHEPRRGYGANVTTVFEKLRTTKFADPYAPAREQFDGRGSHGNGAAMRIAPVALFCHNNITNLLNVASKSSQITHAHKLGINGAVLESLAVRKSLLLDPKNSLDTNKFISELLEEMKDVEKEYSDEEFLEEKDLYQKQLNHLNDLLNRSEHPSDELVVNTLGHSVSALYSVPTAVFAFLKAQREIPGIETENPFRRTIQYAISLGGDTDTIASMAGAIAGAFYGHGVVNESLLKHCESSDYIIELADNLFKLASDS